LSVTTLATTRGDGIPADTRPSSTLLLTDATTSVHACECVDAVESSLDVAATETDLVVVALAGSPIRWLDRWHDATGVAPTRTTFVVVDDTVWIAGNPRDRLTDAAPSDTDVDVALIDSAGNLTDFGITLTEVLDRYRDTDRPVSLCFQSLTVLLQYADDDVVYRFLHTLTTHLRTLGVVGHFHLHADAHTEETVARLRPLFDRVEHGAECA
jgi:hypothetical protein